MEVSGSNLCRLKAYSSYINLFKQIRRLLSSFELLVLSLIREVLCSNLGQDMNHAQIWYRLGNWRLRQNSSSSRVRNNLFSTGFRLGLETIQSLIKCVPGAFIWGKGGRGVKLTTPLQPESRTRKLGFTYSFPHTSSFCGTFNYLSIRITLSS